MKHRISLRQIEGFLLASEQLSFSRASEAMHVTQSAFSQLIRELEAHIGVKLFDRTTRRIHLTAAGEAMYLKMKRGVDVIDDACDEALAIARIDRGHIRVATLSSLAIGVVTRTMSHLRQDFPGISVSMREDFNDALVDLVADGQTDLTVCSEISPRRGLTFEHLFDDELMVVMRPDNRLSRRKLITWDELADQALILTARRTSTRESVSAMLAAHNIHKQAEYEVASMGTSLAMVKAGFGSTFISRVALQDMDIQGLVKVRLREPAIRRMGIYTRSGLPPSPACLKFSELLRIEAGNTLARMA